MNVIILKPGKYLGSDLKAHECGKDDILDTKPWYADEMVKAGQANRKEGAKATVEKKTVAATPGSKEMKVNDRKNKAGQVPLPANAFLGETPGVPSKGKGGKTSTEEDGHSGPPLQELDGEAETLTSDPLPEGEEDTE